MSADIDYNTSENLLLKNALLIDGSGMEPYLASILIRGGKIARIETGAGIAGTGEIPRGTLSPGVEQGSSGTSKTRVIDCAGLYLAPGLIDVHVHFRDPGFPKKEDVVSGLASAARGGYTTVCCMPNTSPAIDTAETLCYIDKKGCAAQGTELFAVAAMTKCQQGLALADIREMDAISTLCRARTGHGIAAISEDGKSLMDERLMREVCLLARELGLPIMDHAEDAALAGGCMNEGKVSARLGVKGISADAELRIVERDIRLARETGVRMHIQHVSAARVVDAIRRAKKELLNISCETAPHYFTLTEEDVARQGARAKMNPPLRTEEDRRAIIQGLRDGTIDMIATDHAPHEMSEKEKPLPEAPFGVVGLDTGFAVAYTALVASGLLTVGELIEKMSLNPARLLGLIPQSTSNTPRTLGRITEGIPADLMIFDANTPFVIDNAQFASRGRNTPFEGMNCRGRVLYTICKGKVIWDNSTI